MGCVRRESMAAATRTFSRDPHRALMHGSFLVS